MAFLVSVDATLVLSGAVLTSYVGVTGLVRRMALDRCMPQFFLKMNRRSTAHRIIIAFFLLSVSVLLITRAEVSAILLCGSFDASAGGYFLSGLSLRLSVKSDQYA